MTQTEVQTIARILVTAGDYHKGSVYWVGKLLRRFDKGFPGWREELFDAYQQRFEDEFKTPEMMRKLMWEYLWGV